MRRSSLDISDNLNLYITLGVALSLLLHLILFLFLARKNSLPAIPDQVFEISFEAPKKMQAPPIAARQIVNTPDIQEETKEPPPTNLESDKNFTTVKEQIHRGDNSNPAKSVQSKPAKEVQPQKQSPAKKEKAPQKNVEEVKPVKETPVKKLALKDLVLDDKTLFDKFSVDKKSRSVSESATETQQLADYKAFSRPPGSGAALLGAGGTSDYLPNLPDGDLTLLNTKANRFAVFVRRVATQVFGEIRRAGWETLTAGNINSLNDYTVVRAIMDPSGKLVSVKLENSSGSAKFDSVIVGAARFGTRDSNPPAEAKAADGNFHFIFQSKSWGQYSAHAKTGAMFERRWLLLATGLE